MRRYILILKYEQTDLKITAEQINTLGQFCGKRDIPELSREKLREVYGIEQADVFVLFGGSILEGGKVLAQAIKTQISKKYIIVGGAGHTTETLRQIVRQNLRDTETKDLTEAEIFDKYLQSVYGLKADYLECKSTNCGNNITFLLDLIKENNIECNSIILSQDATMQYRMEATLRKYVSDKMLIINYASYQVDVIENNDELTYQNQPLGMWDIERYITLLMGEIPRLRDDENGYGPCGKNFISHVDIPDKVEAAFEQLKVIYVNSVREANPLYETVQEKN